MKNNITLVLKKHFYFSYDMLKKIIEYCPDDLWNLKKGGFVFFQQVLHALCGINYWMSFNGKNFIEPFSDKKLYPELDKEPEENLTKKEISDYLNKIDKIINEFFKIINDDNLPNISALDENLTNMDIILMQIRHVQYHVGHCNSIFRENNIKAVEWIDAV